MINDKFREMIATPEGRQKLAESMVQPLRGHGPHPKRVDIVAEVRKELAAKLMEVFRTQSEFQYLARPPGNSYKPFYRMNCLLLGTNGLAPKVTKAEAAHLLRLADPWFVEALEVDYESFESTYDNIWGCYNEETP